MPKPLTAIFCTAEIPAEVCSHPRLLKHSLSFLRVANFKNKTISAIIEVANAGGPDSTDNLYLLFQREFPPSSQYELTQPSIAPPLSYPFLPHSMEDLISFIDTNFVDSGISTNEFLIADERTIEDKTLPFVDRCFEPDSIPITVRLDASRANAMPVAIQVATMGTAEICTLVDKDGVFRGGPDQHLPSSESGPVEGVSAPR